MKGGFKMKYKQIRVQVEKQAFAMLKTKSKELRMTLEHYSGLILSGYRILKEEKH